MSSLVLLFILKLVNMSILIVYSCTSAIQLSEAKRENDQNVEDKQAFLINCTYDNTNAEYDGRRYILSSSVVAKKHKSKRLVNATSSINNSTIEFKPIRSPTKETNNRAILDKIPKIRVKDSPVNLFERSYFKFICEVTQGTHPLTFMWLKNNERLFKSQDNSQILPGHHVSTFFIEKVSEMNSGTYTCIVSNSYGSDNISVTLNVQPINCGDPGYVENADRVAFKFNYNSNVTYRCKENYQMIGIPFLLCTIKGHWNRNKPKCELIKCPDIVSNDKHLKIDLHNDEATGLIVNSIVKFSCASGFHLKGLETSVCQKSGEWNGTLPYCEKNFCSRPLSKPGLHFIGKYKKVYDVGEQLIASCHNRNRTTFTCTSDSSWKFKLSWSCSAPKKDTCPAIGPLENGSFNASATKEYPFKTKIVFTCDSQYLMQGPPYIICQHDSKWTGVKPNCVLASELTKSSPHLTFLLTVLFIILALILIVISIVLLRLRQRRLERRYWQRYFGNYAYRQSKTNITAPCNQEMKFFRQSKSSVPVTDL